MILRLDPRLPVVWRTPMSVQIGFDPPRVQLDDVSPTTERLIAALVAGVTRPGLTMIAGRDAMECDAVLRAVAPALLGPPADARQAGMPVRVPVRVPTIVVAGSGPTADALVAAFATGGSRVLTSPHPVDVSTTISKTGASVPSASEPSASVPRASVPDADLPDAAVLIGHYVLAPTAGGAWLRRDVPHLPVVFSDSGVQIGPLVTPGTSPCLHCLELHHRDSDAAWPALATQLFGRSTAADAAPLALEAAAQAYRMVLDAVSVDAVSADGLSQPSLAPSPDRSSARSLYILAETGERAWRDWEPHAECDCRGIRLLANLKPTEGQRETGWADEQLRGPDRHWPTRRVQARVGLA